MSYSREYQQRTLRDQLEGINKTSVTIEAHPKMLSPEVKQDLFDAVNVSDLSRETKELLQKMITGRKQDPLSTAIIEFFSIREDLTYIQIAAALCRTNEKLARTRTLKAHLNKMVENGNLSFDKETGIYRFLKFATRKQYEKRVPK